MKVWDARFGKKINKLMERFNASIAFDQRLYKEEIKGSIAYAKALRKAGLLSQEELEKIICGLEGIATEIDRHSFEFSVEDEDIHLAVERRLIEKIGEVGKKLHTGRSRNEQVVLDLRMYLLGQIDQIINWIRGLQKVLVERAEENLDAVMSGYTHLRQAQPLLFSHYILSVFWALEEDKGRLRDCRTRTDVMILGSAALAGSTVELDVHFLTQELGFSKFSPNSLHAVSDRGFVLEFLADAAILFVHLSRVCEDLILWSTSEFGFVEIDETYATGSSLMPQKVNPDSLELIRAKSGRVFGNLVTLLTVMRALPSSYNKDLQEDKEPLFDTVDTLSDCLKIMTGIWKTLKIKKTRMLEVMEDTILATDLVDYLVEKGSPFRDSHRAVGELIKYVSTQGKPLKELSLKEFKKFTPVFAEDVYDALDFDKSINRRKTPGGTSKEAVMGQIKQAKETLKKP